MSDEPANAPRVDLYEVIETVRSRPAMYLGECSIRVLRGYIGGLQHLDHLGAIELVSEPEFGGFHEWVRKKYGFHESTSGWCNMLLSAETVANGFHDVEAHALKQFFKDLEEFRSQ